MPCRLASSTICPASFQECGQNSTVALQGTPSPAPTRGGVTFNSAGSGIECLSRVDRGERSWNATSKIDDREVVGAAICGENEIQARLITSASVGATPTPATTFSPPTVLSVPYPYGRPGNLGRRHNSGGEFNFSAVDGLPATPWLRCVFNSGKHGRAQSRSVCANH